MTEPEQDKERVEESAEQKKRDQPWWQKLSPVMLIAGAVILLLILRSMSLNPDNRSNYLLAIGGLVALLYFLSQTSRPAQDPLVSPREAELLVERDLERKHRWGQFPPMSQPKVTYVGDLRHREGRGTYYDVGVIVHDPFDRPKHLIAKVGATGPERGFVTFIDWVGPMSGREVVQEKTMFPKWVKTLDKHAWMDKIFFRERR